LVEKDIQQVQDDNPLIMEAPKPKKSTYSSSGNSSSSSSAPRSNNVNVTSAPRPVATPPAPAVFEEQIAAEVTPFKERVAEVKEQVAKAAEQVPHEPRDQSPQVRREPPPKPAYKPAPKPVASKPPLEGATSLRDALAKAQAHTIKTETPAPAPRVHAPDLKSTLHDIAPKAEKQAPVGLPEDEIRSMLDVDDDIELDLS
jgi:hypothetical protein